MNQRLHQQSHPPDPHTAAMRQPSALSMLHWAWRQCTPEEQRHFLTEMTTPTQRLQLALGLDDDDFDAAEDT
jgi:hypothetical protein